MKEYLKRNIKGIISKNPQVAAILNSYNLDCVPCSGSCLLKHILDNNYLPEDQAQEMMLRIEQVIYSDSNGSKGAERSKSCVRD